MTSSHVYLKTPTISAFSLEKRTWSEGELGLAVDRGDTALEEGTLLATDLGDVTTSSAFFFDLLDAADVDLTTSPLDALLVLRGLN